MENEKSAELLAGAYQRQYHHNTYPELSNNSEFVTSKEEIKYACMIMAAWKDKQFKEEKEKWLDKAIEWIEYYNNNGGCLFDGWKEDFKEVMEEI